MILTTSNLARYLIDRRLLPAEAIVDGDFVTVETSRRNRNFKVIRRSGDGVFVKQAQSGEAQDIATLRREAECYGLPQRVEALAPLAALMPTLLGFDPGLQVLVLRLIDGGENLSEHHRRLGAYPSPIAVALGRALALLHGAPVPDAVQGQTAPFPRTVPWILSLQELDAAQLPGLSAANAHLLQIVREHSGFHAALDTLRNGWTFDSLIHGDMKWDNCVVPQSGGHAEAPKLTIVDWELVDRGDPCWDTGAILQAYLAHWILSVPVAPGVDPARLMSMATVPLATVQPAIGAFWHAYVTERGTAATDRRALLERAVRCAAARMIQTAYEYLYTAQTISPGTLLLLQVSLNMLTRPADAIGQLLHL